MSRVRIRAADIGDVEILDRIALLSKAHWGYSKEVIRTWVSDLRTPVETIKSLPTVVAELNATPVGFAQLDSITKPWELVSLFVLPDHMGKGIGKALLAEVLRIARLGGQDRVQIYSDPNAMPFYVACGATLVGAIPAPIDGDPDRVRPQLLLQTGGT